jgi:pSer/pThr/pTyr-binding forkhead associated (FHA) protein
VVLLVSLNGRTQSHTITKDQTTIGRHEQNDVQIPNPIVTGYHAVLKKESDGYLLEDLGSTQGSFVNGERVFKKKLQKGDRILLGTVEVTLKW